MERLFVIISNLIPDNHNNLQCNNVLNRIKRSIEIYEHYVLKSGAPRTSSIKSNIQRDLDIENRVPKKSNDSENHSRASLAQQMKALSDQKIQNMENIENPNLNQKSNSEPNRNIKTGM